MQRMTLDATTEVYIIFRVFNIGKPDMGMRLYVHPRSMEFLGNLKFEPASYVVTPSRSTATEDDEEL